MKSNPGIIRWLGVSEMQTLKRVSTVNTDLPIKLPLASEVEYKGYCGLICGKKERKTVYQRKRSKWVVLFAVSSVI